MKKPEDQDQIREDIRQCQNQISEFEDKLKKLEQKEDSLHDDMIGHKRVAEMADAYMHDYQSRVSAFVQEASAYNFVKKYESRVEELLRDPRRRRVEEELMSMEKEIRNRIGETEEEISLERRKAYALNEKADSLKHDLKILLLADEK